MRISFNKRKRTEYQIMFQILDALSRGPLPKTKLMYKADLTYVVTEKYLPYLQNIGAIKKDKDLYYITQRGQEIRNLLETYIRKAEEIKKVLEELRRTIEMKNNDEGVRTKRESKVIKSDR
ncbi:winged helix-turn-helix domain-containing protein [Sulfurisphaera ohwakuensis]|uniref:winged helix-turn-helix domain-containing protein n=1 Tax=Sulfurisphaera ohwakuensis TaxID=69656 RepID=UPI0036F307EE